MFTTYMSFGQRESLRMHKPKRSAQRLKCQPCVAGTCCRHRQRRQGRGGSGQKVQGHRCWLRVFVVPSAGAATAVAAHVPFMCLHRVRELRVEPCQPDLEGRGGLQEPAPLLSKPRPGEEAAAPTDSVRDPSNLPVHSAKLVCRLHVAV